MRVEQFEEAIEDALWHLEIEGEAALALAEYERVTHELETALSVGQVKEADALAVLSYGYLRQANIVRIQGDLEKAHALGEVSVRLGRASDDPLALARALLNHAGTLAMTKDPALRPSLDEALSLFSAGSSKDHVQGVGWHWILVADLCDAELLPGGSSKAIDAAKSALDVLIPIDNRQGIVRAWSALARAYEKTGDLDAGQRAREAAQDAAERAQSEKR
jgi:tetratricopeptide (TPR) repeat protein